MSAPLKSAPITERSEIEAGWHTTKRVAPFLWPVGNFDLRARVVLALLALVAVFGVVMIKRRQTDVQVTGLPRIPNGWIRLLSSGKLPLTASSAAERRLCFET